MSAPSPRDRGKRAFAALALAAWPVAAVACGAHELATVSPEAPGRARAGADASADAPTLPTMLAAADAAPRPVDAAVTTGSGPVVVARRALEPSMVVCAREERRALSFEHAPLYTDKVERDGEFSARLFVGNASTCGRQVALALSFTPPRTTATRTQDFVAYVPAGGAFVELKLDAKDLTDANVTPGRYAITFAVLDEDATPVGRALSGNPFRRGRDDVSIVIAPKLPARIGLSETLSVPLTIQNLGDTANKVTPLVVFTRPGQTTGIEHYGEPLLVVPGTATYVVKIDRDTRDERHVKPGSWLVTISTFDSAGDRTNSFAGMPLSIGAVDLRVKRPDLPVRLAEQALLRVVFELDNRGDAPDEVSCVVAFTKPGTTASHELVFKKVVAPGTTAFEALVDAGRRRQEGIGKGAWLMTTSAFTSAGERIKSFTGHYLEITD